jgi:hypothetical protein
MLPNRWSEARRGAADPFSLEFAGGSGARPYRKTLKTSHAEAGLDVHTRVRWPGPGHTRTAAHDCQPADAAVVATTVATGLTVFCGIHMRFDRRHVISIYVFRRRA